MSNHAIEFLEFLRREGFDPDPRTKITADDAIHRFSRSGKKEQTGSYKLAVSGDGFAYGWANDFSTGNRANYSKTDKRVRTQDEKDRLKAQTLKAKAEAEQRRLDERQQAKQAAATIWQNGSYDGPETPYEARKRIKRFGAKTSDAGDLIVPLLDMTDEILGVQTIRPDGEKRFNPGCDKKGHFFRMGEWPEKYQPVYIVEGYATGATVHEASGICTVVAWDAGNLLSVATKLSKKYRIIIAADNDAARVVNGDYQNIGLIKAQEAALAVNGEVCAPLMTSESDDGIEHPPRSCDFNDLHLEQGIEAVRAALGISLPVEQKQIESVTIDAANWKSELVLTRKGEMVANSLTNYALFLENHPQLKDVFAYDEFGLATIVKSCPPWERAEKFQVHILSTNDLTPCLLWFDRHGLRIADNSAWNLILNEARKNSYHPARDYISSLEWDGEERLSRVLTEIYDCTDDPKYLAFVFRKWLIGSVSRLFEPGKKFDTMIIFEGPHNI
jgi:putative DNA primase/helicase